MPLTLICLHHLPQIIPRYFPRAWKIHKRFRVDVNLGNSEVEYFRVKQTRARSNPRVYFASIIIWREPMAEFFQTVHLREEVFPLINPRTAAVRIRHVQNSFLRVWRATGSATEWHSARSRLESMTCCLCGRSAALQTPALMARGPLGL